jgi:hypothetical protein
VIPVVFGLAAGFAFASWRNAPPMSDPQSAALAAVILGFGLLSYGAGRRRRPGAVATATATATAASAAQSNSQVVINLGDGARAQAARMYGELDDVAWRGDALAPVEACPELVEDHDIATALELAYEHDRDGAA